jgi:hypothetical protein
LLGVAALAVPAHADRLIDIPTADKLPFGEAEYQVLYGYRGDGRFENEFGFGLTTSLEIDCRQGNIEAPNVQGTFDLSYCFVNPISNFFPGLAVGIQDVENRETDGRRPYMAATYREGFNVVGGEQPGDITLGVTYLHKALLPFVGVVVPFSRTIRFVAEDDGVRINAGITISNSNDFALKLLVRDRESLAGLSISHKF